MYKEYWLPTGKNQNVANTLAGLLFLLFFLAPQNSFPKYSHQGSRYLVKDFGTSKSPKSTRQRAKYFGRDCPASGTLR